MRDGGGTMKKGAWVWIVLAASVAVAVYFFFSGRSSRLSDTGPHLWEGEMATAEEFDKTPPTGADMNLDEMDISFKGETNKTAKGTSEKKPE